MRGIWVSTVALGVILGAAACQAPAVPAHDGSGGSGDHDGCDPLCPAPPPPASEACQQPGCERLELHAEQLPLALYLLVDRSGSMWDQDLWQESKKALIDFVGDANSAGIGVGLKLFPHAGNNACSDTWYKLDANLEVPYGELAAAQAPSDTQEQAVIDALNAVDRGEMSTPIEVALSGAYQWAEWRLHQQAEQRVAVVLITDGRPELCTGGKLDVSALAARAATERAKHGIVTYTIGLPGADMESLQEIAAAGSDSGDAMIVDNAATLSAQLNEALTHIRTANLPCEIEIPAEAPTDQIDICYAPGGTEQSTPLMQDDDWSLEGETIRISGALCNTLQNDDQGQLEVVFNCPIN